MDDNFGTRTKPFDARIHFPTYPHSKTPLRAGFDKDSKRPGICTTYTRRKNGHMSLTKITLPKAAIK